MALYTKIIPFILKWEGGLSKNPNDTAAAYPVPDGTGNHTNKGITWATWANVYGTSKDSVDRFYNMAVNDWGTIFKNLYWNKIGGDNINSQRIADILVNWGWAAGTSTPAKTIQRIVNINTDGIIGPKTVAAINASNEQDTFNKLRAANIDFFNSLSAQPKYSTFKKGWNDRLKDLFTRYIPSIPGTSVLTFALIGAAIWFVLKK